jgi:YD repeat-containing protein
MATAAVSITYDCADRRTSLTLPNGIVVEYGYDDDLRLTSLTYKLGARRSATSPMPTSLLRRRRRVVVFVAIVRQTVLPTDLVSSWF